MKQVLTIALSAVALLLSAAVLTGCCCGGDFEAGFKKAAEEAIQEADEASKEVAEVDKAGSAASAGGGALGSLTADDIISKLKGEGYKLVDNKWSERDAGGAKTISVTGIKGTKAASVILYSYSGPGSKFAMKAWKDGVKDTPGTVVAVDGTTALMVTVSGDKTEAARLLKLIKG
jgi:hypothetical protein